MSEARPKATRGSALGREGSLSGAHWLPNSGPQPAPGESGRPPILLAAGIGKTYRMGRVELNVLRGCDLCVQPGEFLAIMGKSGSGKSTLLHILGALDIPDTGQVHYAGAPMFLGRRRRRRRLWQFELLSAAERRRIQLRRRHFGFVFQFYHLLPDLNVLENVLITRMVGASTWQWIGRRAAARQDAREVLERVGLGDRLRHRPNELSGGERQRVAIARALVHRPAILLADEPTGNLDAETGGKLMELLVDLHRAGQTIVMVTHDAGCARAADRTLRLENGRLHE